MYVSRMNLLYTSILLITGTLNTVVHSARILAICPLPYFSHQYFFRPFWKELARRGHDVVLLTTSPIKEDIPNLEQKDIGFVLESMSIPRVEYMNDFMKIVETHFDIVNPILEAQLASDPLQELIHNKSEHFDLVIAEYFGPEMFSFKRRFKTPLIIHSPMDIPNDWYSATGSPGHELLYSFFKVIPVDPGIVERFWKFLYKFREVKFLWYYEQINAVARKYFGKYALTVKEAKEEVDLFLVNTNYVLHEMRPLAPTHVQLGGGMFLYADQPELPEDLRVFLDGSIEGVIYFSLGTLIDINSMTMDCLMMITDTFPLLPYKILWKTDVLPRDILQSANKSGNVIISKWLPQPKVLMHQNVKLFVTQGGVQSLEEAVILKKPSLVIPIFADQHANAHRIESLGLGVQLDITTLTTSKFHEAIKKVLDDEEIQVNLKKYSKILLDQPMNPLERAVWWVEYVIRHKGARHLHAKSLPWWQAIYADVALVILIKCTVLAYIVVEFWKFMKRNLFKIKQQ